MTSDQLCNLKITLQEHFKQKSKNIKITREEALALDKARLIVLAERLANTDFPDRILTDEAGDIVGESMIRILEIVNFISRKVATL